MARVLLQRLGVDMGDGRSISPDAVLDLGMFGIDFPIVLLDDSDYSGAVVGHLSGAYVQDGAIWGDVELFPYGGTAFTPVFLDFRGCDFTPGVPMTLTRGTLTGAHVRFRPDPDCDGQCFGLAHRDACLAHVIPY